MKVQLDLDPRLVWRYGEIAETQGVPLSTVVNARLSTGVRGVPLRLRVRALVLAGWCDADIAAELHQYPGYIATVRRGEGLPANPRYRRAA